MALVLDTKSLFDRGDYSDVKIKIGAQEFKCHKLVLCDTSQYFNLLCGANSNFRERALSVIELKEDGPKAAEAVLRHLYKFDYTEIEDKLGDFDAADHLNVALAADKYALPKFEQEALNHLDSEIQRLERECADTGDVRKIFELLELISEHAENYDNLASWVTRLTKVHLPNLFKLKEFRASLESPSATRSLALCIGTVKRGHLVPEDANNRIVKESFLRCVDCGMIWLRRKLYGCPECGNKKVQNQAIEQLWRVK